MLSHCSKHYAIRHDFRTEVFLGFKPSMLTEEEDKKAFHEAQKKYIFRELSDLSREDEDDSFFCIQSESGITDKRETGDAKNKGSQ